MSPITGTTLLVFAMLSSWLITGLVVRLASRLGLIHAANHRSSHVGMVPHGGGLGFVIGGTTAGVFLVYVAAPPSSADGVGLQLLAVMGFSLTLAVLGLVDDVRQLPARVRFGAQLLTVAGLLWWLGDLPDIAIGAAPLPGPDDYHAAGWLLSGMVLFAGLWWINLFNFMDGIDGIAAGQAIAMLIVGSGLAALMQPDVTSAPLWLLMLCISAAIAGFLLFNWPPARVFMGDVGSTWLGIMIFALALLTIKAGWLSYAAWLVLSAVFVSDATVTLIVRMLRGERWWAAHRNHAYQRLSRQLIAAGRRRGIEPSAARASAHRRCTLAGMAINLLWLAPLAVAALLWPQQVWVLLGLAYLPLIIGATLLGAGKPDDA